VASGDDRHLRRVTLSDERGAWRADCVHDGHEIVHPGLDRNGAPGDMTGHADAAHVEPDDPSEPPETANELHDERELGERLEMTCPVERQHEVVLRAVADHLIGDVDVARAHPLRGRQSHGGHSPSSASDVLVCPTSARVARFTRPRRAPTDRGRP